MRLELAANIAHERTKSISARKASTSAIPERDQRQQITVVRHDDIVEHKLQTDRDRKTDGLQHERHQQYLGRGGSKPVAATQQLPDPYPRAFRFALERFGRPGFEHDPGEPFIDFLQRHAPAAYGRIKDHDAPTAHAGEYDEMIMVPVQNARQAQPPQMRQLGAQRPRSKLYARGDADEVVQRRPPE